MPNISKRDDKDSTSSGHGALGMGGQPSDDPRDLKSGGGGRLDDDRGGGTGPVGGASGGERGDLSGGSVAGVKADKAIDDEIRSEAGKPRSQQNG